jgi:hypothetical protein
LDPQDHFNHLIETALHERLKRLWEKLLAPFDGKPLEESYLALIYMKGIKPSLTSELTEFFAAKVEKKKKIEVLPDAGDPSEYRQEFFRKHLYADIISALGLAGDFTLSLPATPAGSGAQVFLVRDAKGGVVGALKIQSKESGGLDELLSSLSMETFLSQNRPDVNIVKVADYGILNDESYFTIITPARSKDIDGWLHSKPSEKMQALLIEKAAKMTADLHRSNSNDGNSNGVTPPKLSKFIMETFKGNSLYDVHWMRDFIHSQKLEIRGEQIGMSPELVNVLESKVALSVDEYERDLDNNVQLFRRTTTHGDYHGGNIFFDAEHSLATMIDYGGIAWTIAKDNHAGTGDPGNDLGRLMAHILLEDVKDGTYKIISYNKLKLFYSHYLNFMSISLHSPEELVLRRSVNMFINRYFAIQCGDVSGTKFKSRSMSTPHLVQILFKAWSDLDPVLWAE